MEKILLQGAAMDVSDIMEDHPNKQYWRGIVASVGIPSDKPPGGSRGYRVKLEREGVLKNIDTLKGVPVNVAWGSFDRHDMKSVIGIVANGWVEGNDLWAEGYFYAQNFPQECMEIRAAKEDFGFSYELLSRKSELVDNVLCVKDMCFTGMSVLHKEKAAYNTSTQMLVANQDEKVEDSVNKEEMMDVLNGFLSKVEEKIKASAEATETKMQEIKASVDGKIEEIKASVDASNVKVEEIKAGMETKIDEIKAAAEEVKAAQEVKPPTPTAAQTIVANADVTPPEPKQEQFKRIYASSMGMEEKLREIVKINATGKPQ